MVIWIVIGSLVVIILAFLIVMSVKDKKKEKKIREEKKVVDHKKSVAGNNLVVFIFVINREVQKELKKFQPSIGKTKMRHIKEMARQSIIKFENSTEYQYAMDSNDNKKVVSLIEKLKNNNCNTWNTKLQKELEENNKEYKKLDKDFVKVYTTELIISIKEVKKNEFAK